MEADAKECFVMQRTRHACKNIQDKCSNETNLCLLGVKSFLFDSLRFFLARLLRCLLRLRRLCLSSVSLCSSAEDEG